MLVAVGLLSCCGCCIHQLRAMRQLVWALYSNLHNDWLLYQRGRRARILLLLLLLPMLLLLLRMAKAWGLLLQPGRCLLLLPLLRLRLLLPLVHRLLRRALLLLGLRALLLLQVRALLAEAVGSGRDCGTLRAERCLLHQQGHWLVGRLKRLGVGAGERSAHAPPVHQPEL
jgi:hypothetical protein